MDPVGGRKKPKSADKTKFSGHGHTLSGTPARDAYGMSLTSLSDEEEEEKEERDGSEEREQAKSEPEAVEYVHIHASTPTSRA